MGITLKKSLSVLALLAIMLTGCSATSHSAQPSAEPAAATSAPSSAPLPNEVGKTLDKAKKELEGLGFRVKAKDTVEGKSIIVKSNWEVVSQDPVAGASAPEASTVNLGVKHLSATPSPTATPTPTPTPVAGAGGTADAAAQAQSVQQAQAAAQAKAAQQQITNQQPASVATGPVAVSGSVRAGGVLQVVACRGCRAHIDRADCLLHPVSL